MTKGDTMPEKRTEENAGVWITGTVLWFDHHMGYGFITPKEGGPNVFVHFTAIQEGGFKFLEGGQEVKFKIVEGRKGPQAAEVIKAGDDEDDDENDWIRHLYSRGE